MICLFKSLFFSFFFVLAYSKNESSNVLFRNTGVLFPFDLAQAGTLCQEGGILSSVLGVLNLTLEDVKYYRKLIFNEANDHIEGTNGAQEQKIEIGAHALGLAENYQIRDRVAQVLRFISMSNSIPFLLDKLVREKSSSENSILFDSPQINLMDAFCQTSEYTFDINGKNADYTMCKISNVLMAVLACRHAKSEAITCSTLQPVKTFLPNFCNGHDTDTLFEEFNFTDLRTSENNDDGIKRMPLILNSSKTFKDDGYKAFLLYRAAAAALNYTKSSYFCKREIEELIPNWATEKIYTYSPLLRDSDDPQYGMRTPILFLNKPKENYEEGKGNICKRILIVRGTANQLEWLISFQLKFMRASNDIEAHQGYLILSQALVSNIFNDLEDIIAKNNCTEGLELVISGHSLGGAITYILALLLQESRLGHQLKITAITFGAPNVFNNYGVEYIRRTFNSRNYVIDLDPIPQGPCPIEKYKRGHFRCNEFVNNGNGFSEFSQLPGRLDFAYRDLALSDVQPGEAEIIYEYSGTWRLRLILPAALQFGLVHTCSYSCLLSRVCGSSWQCAMKPPGYFSFGLETDLCPSYINEIELSTSN